jgi:hypothetical protein
MQQSSRPSTEGLPGRQADAHQGSLGIISTSENHPRGSELAVHDCQNVLIELRGDPLGVVIGRFQHILRPIPHAKGYTVFREILLAADHNAYHVGEFAILRQVLDLWPEDNKYLTGTPEE